MASRNGLSSFNGSRGSAPLGAIDGGPSLVNISKRSRQTIAKHYRKTARGQLVKVVREAYRRDDIDCHLEHCRQCRRHTTAVRDDGKLGSGNGSGRKTVGKQGLVVVPDTNILLLQLDLLEHGQGLAEHVLLLQTVMEEVRHRSLPLYTRLQALTRDDRLTVFYDRLAYELKAVQAEGESDNDYMDRAIRSACLWLARHARAQGLVLEVVLLSNDKENRRRAIEEAGKVEAPILAVSLDRFLSTRFPHLLDLMNTQETSQRETSALIYAEHLPLEECRQGINTGQLFQGPFALSTYNVRQGSIRAAGQDKSILLFGKRAMNRAINGDIVAVLLLPKSQWRAPLEAAEEAEEGISGEEEVSERQGSGEAVQPTGQVVGIIKRNWRPVVAHLVKASVMDHGLEANTQQSILVRPVDQRMPLVKIQTRQANALMTKKIVIAIDHWAIDSWSPSGHFIRSLGEINSKEAETEALLLQYDVPFRPFGPAILECLPLEGSAWKVPPKSEMGDWKDRLDLRHLDICSIDPPGCQDIDDALHAIALPNGNIECGVHIADVSRFVKAGNAMDREADSRGTTVYLVDKRIDMLPELLGTNLCSLRPFVERLAFSVIWELDAKTADIVNVQFRKSVIASKSAFTYEEAQIRKDDVRQDDPVTRGIRLLAAMAQKLRAKRMAAGALELSSPEVKVHTESETSDPNIEAKKSFETNGLVEEFMLLANISVAEKIHSTYPMTSILRNHASPPRANFDGLNDVLLKRRGMTLDVSTSKTLNASLRSLDKTEEPDFTTLVRIMVTRCMMSAEYLVSGSTSPDQFKHYGLASPIYTHFTSPIRRYADILVHRQLASSIGFEPGHPSLVDRQALEKTCGTINFRHKMAQTAGRASVEFSVCQALKGRVIEETGWVLRTFSNGIVVFVSKLGIEGLVSVKQLQLDAEKHEVTIDGVTVGVFDKVTVQVKVLQDEHSYKGKLVLELLKPVKTTA